MNRLRSVLVLALAASLVSACSGGGGGGYSPPPQPTSTPTSFDAAAFTCPTSNATGTAIARAPRGTTGRPARTRSGAAAVSPGLLAVTYDAHALGTARSAFAARESAAGGTMVHEYDFPRTALATRLLAIAPAHAAAAIAALRIQPGVRNVVALSARYPQSVSQPYFTNDPYFTGFATTVPPSASATAPPATFEVAPYEESATVPGQWNMHAIGLEHAFGYSQANNGSGVTNAGALGSAGVKIAVIDTGEDVASPELASKIAYQKCFITNPDGQTSTSSFTTDGDGHGTDVSGIAAAATNNGIGFAGAGGNASIYAYRVQATPKDACSDPTSTDPQCNVLTSDIASAILDALAQNVNVINISLGGGTCSGGVDPDSLEGNAIAEALAANVIVVAAAGNDGKPGVQAPACDTGVIAAGATSLDDGSPNGTGAGSGSPSAPREYVASYSDYGSPGAAPKNASAWGIVAPGGDPQNNADVDNLHWIEDTWTSTPVDANFAGDCSPDYSLATGPLDCRTLIAGTSMASPTVAGAAALIVAANPAYQSPAKMKALLCTTADDIGDGKEGCGRLNAYRAMAIAVGDPATP